MRTPGILFAALLAILPFSRSEAAPLGSVDCIEASWTDAQALQIFEALNSKDDANIAAQQGKEEFLFKTRQCAKKHHWSQAVKEEAIGYTTTDLLVKVVAANIRQFGGNVAILDDHFAANRSEFITRVDTRQYDLAAIGPVLESAGFDVHVTKAFELVPVYFAFVALREQSRDRFLSLK